MADMSEVRPGRGESMPATALDFRSITDLNPELALCADCSYACEKAMGVAHYRGIQGRCLHLHTPASCSCLFGNHPWRRSGRDGAPAAGKANLAAMRSRPSIRGADHVCIQVLTATPRSLSLAEWRDLASALLEAMPKNGISESGPRQAI
jgi:hypothetical protein